MVSLEFFIDLILCPRVDSASNRNENQECCLGCKGGWCVGLATLPPPHADCLELLQASTSCSPQGLYSDCSTQLLVLFPLDTQNRVLTRQWQYRPIHTRHAVLRPCRSKSDFWRPRHSTAGARHGVCELQSAVSRRPVGDLPRFGFFRLLNGHSRRLFTRMLLPFGMCLTVLMAMETAHYTEHELILQLKSIFLVSLCNVSTVCSSFDCR